MSAWWRIAAHKYDRRLHSALPAELIRDDGQQVVFRVQPDAVIHHVTRGMSLPINRRSTMVFWRACWYNVYLNYSRTDSAVFDHYYCNVGLPPTVDAAQRTLRFVDLDLDVRIWPDGQHAILDEDEFAAHRVQFAYPPDVAQRAQRTVDTILAAWHARQFPFDTH
jgi:uncharacterized protein